MSVIKNKYYKELDYCECDGKNAILNEFDWFIEILQDIKYGIVRDNIYLILERFDDLQEIYARDIVVDIFRNILRDKDNGMDKETLKLIERMVN